MTEQNALVVSEQANVPALSSQMKELGVSASDLIIPKMLLMQNTSEYVGDKKAAMGDIVNSQTLEVLGGEKSPVSLVPLKMYKTWRVYDMDSGQPEFLRQEAVTADNEKLPWEDTEENEDGKKIPIRRDLCMNFFCLLYKEVQSGEAFPVVASFKRTSIQAGRQLATQIFMQACLNRPPYAKTALLSVKTQKAEKNTYAVFEISKGADLPKDHADLAALWLKRLAEITYKVDEADESEATASAAAPAAAPVVVGGSGPEMKF